MNDQQKLGLAIMLVLIAAPLLLVALFMAPISLAGKLAIVGGVLAAGALMVRI